MKKRVIALIIMTAVAALSFGACKKSEKREESRDGQVLSGDYVASVQDDGQPGEAEETVAPEVSETDPAETTAEAVAFPTGIPLNEPEYVEWSESILYEVIADCISWSGNDVQTSGGDLYEGMVVNGVATDGYYVILDDQRVVEASNLQILE